MTLELQMVCHLDVYHVLYGHMAAPRARDMFAPSHRSVLEDKKRREMMCVFSVLLIHFCQSNKEVIKAIAPLLKNLKISFRADVAY